MGSLTESKRRRLASKSSGRRFRHRDSQTEKGSRLFSKLPEPTKTAPPMLRKTSLIKPLRPLKNRLRQIPTLSAQYTLALLYLKLGHGDEAKKYAQQAAISARSKGAAVDTVESEELLKDIEAQETLIGPKTELPKGGDSFENALPISEGRYTYNKFFTAFTNNFFKLKLKAGQTLVISFRTPDVETAMYYSVSIHDRDGIALAEVKDYHRNVKLTATWTASADGTYYINFSSGNPVTVYLVSVR
jgi:hypothetical protein